jgi:hypothetical protein
MSEDRRWFGLAQLAPCDEGWLRYLVWTRLMLTMMGRHVHVGLEKPVEEPCRMCRCVWTSNVVCLIVNARAAGAGGRYISEGPPGRVALTCRLWEYRNLAKGLEGSMFGLQRCTVTGVSAMSA